MCCDLLSGSDLIQLVQFLVAEWLSFWAPELGITLAELGDYWKGLNIPHPCGPCNDCAGSSPGTEPTYTGCAGLGGDHCAPLRSANPCRAFLQQC